MTMTGGSSSNMDNRKAHVEAPQLNIREIPA